MGIVKRTIDKNIPKNKVKETYFKNNPEQWVVFLKLLESVLKLIRNLKLIQYKNILITQYLNIEADINNTLRIIELTQKQNDLSFSNNLSEVAKRWKSLGVNVRNRRRAIGYRKKYEELLQKKKAAEFNYERDYAQTQSALDSFNEEFSQLVSDADEYLLSMMLDLFN